MSAAVMPKIKVMRVPLSSEFVVVWTWALLLESAIDGEEPLVIENAGEVRRVRRIAD